MTIALADVAVVVSDAKASAKWWKDNLGFAVHNLGGSGHAWLVAPPGDRFVLHLCEGFAPPESGNTGIAFVTDDIEALVARMTKGGVQFPEPVKKNDWGASGKFADPDGNSFWLLGAPAKMVRDTLQLRAPSGKTPRKARPATKAAQKSRKKTAKPRGKKAPQKRARRG